jgi:hypothetical protein
MGQLATAYAGTGLSEIFEGRLQVAAMTDQTSDSSQPAPSSDGFASRPKRFSRSLPLSGRRKIAR